MQLSVKGKQIDVGDALRTHVETQLKEIVSKYFSETLDAHVTFSREAHMFRADITVHANRGMILHALADANEPYPAFDMAAARMQKQLRRYKNKIKHHHHNENQIDDAVASSFVLKADDHDREEEAHENPVVVAEMTTPIATLTVSEAVMRMDLGNLPALMFRNRANDGLNMIYRRADGHIGWVDPANTAVAAKKVHA